MNDLQEIAWYAFLIMTSAGLIGAGLASISDKISDWWRNRWD